jgi:hypothetical protein
MRGNKRILFSCLVLALVVGCTPELPAEEFMRRISEDDRLCLKIPIGPGVDSLLVRYRPTEFFAANDIIAGNGAGAIERYSGSLFFLIDVPSQLGGLSPHVKSFDASLFHAEDTIDAANYQRQPGWGIRTTDRYLVQFPRNSIQGSMRDWSLAVIPPQCGRLVVPLDKIVHRLPRLKG